jgi:hypothetical protein
MADRQRADRWKADRQKAGTQKVHKQMHFTSPYLMAISVDVIDARCIEGG